MGSHGYSLFLRSPEGTHPVRGAHLPQASMFHTNLTGNKMKRFLLAAMAVFIVWAALDFVIHGIILQSAYEATVELWRPMNEMNLGLMYLVTAATAVAFVGMYAAVASKTVASGAWFGALFGIAAGVSMGFGTYCVMPIPLFLAFGWFLGTLAEAVVAGVIVGAIAPGGALGPLDPGGR